MLLAKPYMQWREHNEYIKERKLRGDIELQAVNPYQVFNDVTKLLMTHSMFRNKSNLPSMIKSNKI